MTIRLPLARYGIIQLPLGIALIAWGVTSGYQQYQGDRCSQAFEAQTAANQISINHVQARLDMIRKREAALGARAAEVAKKFNGAEKDGK